MRYERYTRERGKEIVGIDFKERKRERERERERERDRAERRNRKHPQLLFTFLLCIK